MSPQRGSSPVEPVGEHWPARYQQTYPFMVYGSFRHTVMQMPVCRLPNYDALVYFFKTNIIIPSISMTARLIAGLVLKARFA